MARHLKTARKRPWCYCPVEAIYCNCGPRCICGVCDECVAFLAEDTSGIAAGIGPLPPIAEIEVKERKASLYLVERIDDGPRSTNTKNKD